MPKWMFYIQVHKRTKRLFVTTAYTLKHQMFGDQRHNFFHSVEPGIIDVLWCQQYQNIHCFRMCYCPIVNIIHGIFESNIFSVNMIPWQNNADIMNGFINASRTSDGSNIYSITNLSYIHRKMKLILKKLSNYIIYNGVKSPSSQKCFAVFRSYWVSLKIIRIKKYRLCLRNFRYFTDKTGGPW